MQESQETARPKQRSAPVAQLVVLVLLLGVFAWRARSCQTRIEEKHRAALQHDAQFAAQIAAEPSPLPLDPYARRAAMAAALRLRPDRRFLLAFGQIQQLTGAAPLTVESRFAEGKWKLSAGVELPELPDYPDLMRALVAFAQRRLAASPLSESIDSPAAEPALLWEPEARAALPAELARWGTGQHAVPVLHKAARAAASLCFYLVDQLETDDELAAKAIALVALDIGSGKAQTDSEEAVLASALGYGRASRELGARLQGESPLKFFLAGDDERLHESARLREAGPADRYLRLRRALDRQNEDELNRALATHPAAERLELGTLALLLREREMQHFAPVAFSLPLFVLAAAERVPAQVEAGESQGEMVSASAESTAAALHVEPAALTQRLEGALKKLDPEIRDYLRATWLSALRRQGEYFADSQGNRAAVARFAEQLAKDSAPTVQLFQRWFAARTLLDSGQTAAALSAGEKLQGMGGAAVGSILDKADSAANFSDPRILRAARALVPRLDTRVAHRALLGRIAWSDLQDLRASERLLRSAFEADPDGNQSLREWFARLSGDARELQRIGGDKLGLRTIRSEAWTHLWELGAEHAAAAEQGFRSMLDEDPNDESTALDLCKQLRLAGRIEDGRTLLLAWLRRNDGPGLRAANIRDVLARYSFLAGRYDEGLEMVRPALETGNAGSFEYAALNLAGAGRATEARQMVDKLLQRYRSSRAVARAAEVEWQLGDLDAAGKRLAQGSSRLTSADYRDEVADGFDRLFGARPDQAAAAAAAAVKAGVDAPNLIALATALESRGHPEVAVRVLSAIPAEGQHADYIRLASVRPLWKARGEEAVRSWLKQSFPSVPDDRGHFLALSAFREGLPELVWDLVPDPKGSDEMAETTWMLRAAQLALLGDAAPPERKRALREHYATTTGPMRQIQIGRYLLGEVPEAEVAKLVTNLPASCEVPYYFGARAQGEKRFGDAADWYRVAVECGQREQAEYVFANSELYRWRGEKAVFSKLR